MGSVIFRHSVFWSHSAFPSSQGRLLTHAFARRKAVVRARCRQLDVVATVRRRRRRRARTAVLAGHDDDESHVRDRTVAAVTALAITARALLCRQSGALASSAPSVHRSAHDAAVRCETVAIDDDDDEDDRSYGLVHV